MHSGMLAVFVGRIPRLEAFFGTHRFLRLQLTTKPPKSLLFALCMRYMHEREVAIKNKVGGGKVMYVIFQETLYSIGYNILY